MAGAEPQPAATRAKEDAGGPFYREMAFLEQRTAILRAADAPAPEAAPPAAPAGLVGDDPRGRQLQEMAERGARMGVAADAPGPEENLHLAALALPPHLPPDFRLDRIRAFRRRQYGEEDVGAERAVAGAPAAPLPAPANNWVPIGPAVMRQGQGAVRPAVSGRIAGIAVAPGGQRVYAGSANGGVWRSDNGGLTWISKMDTWDLIATSLQSDSLSVGAIALDPADPDRVYVGTGEGNTVFITNGQIFGTSAFFGVGPIRTDDGGQTWVQEPTAPGSPSLQGSAFFQLAVDPGDRDRVVAATLRGLFRREPDGAGGFHWSQKLSGIFSSVQAARAGGATTYYAARWGGGIFRSADGESWTSIPGFPTQNVGRLGLAVVPTDPSVVYALAARADNDHVLGLWRFAASAWRPVAGIPNVLFGDQPNDPNFPGQGGYDLAVAVDPTNPDRVYLGGSTVNAQSQWSGSVYRGMITHGGNAANPTFRMTPAYIGARVHADAHTLEFTPGNGRELWVGCDGGVFATNEADGLARFEQRNNGLSTLTMNHLGVHPTEDAVLFCGTQDNGHGRYTGEETWLHAVWGDGGYAVIHPRKPSRILTTYVRNTINRAEDGGQGYASWNDVSVPLVANENVLFYAPLEGPRKPTSDAEADLVAFGSDRLWLSADFGDTWGSIPGNSRAADVLDERIRAIEFATASRIYAGTMGGGVYRFDFNAGGWTRTRLNPTTTGPGALPFSGVAVTSINVDPADPTGGSIYITLGGIGDFRHVWRYDGHTSSWQARSGPANQPGQQLLDVQHNAIIADPANATDLYAGADVGVWRSRDAGTTWEAFSFGLPDVAVFDMEIQPLRRLLWAATHGRGVYEYALDSATALPVELYLRHTELDRGRRRTEVGLPDPTNPNREVDPHRSPDIKVDVPDASGQYQTGTNQISAYDFADRVADRGSAGAPRNDATGSPLTYRVYVQVHTRGVRPASGVRVTLLAAPLAGASTPVLPPGYETMIQRGSGVSTATWITIGTATLPELRVDGALVAEFDLPTNVVATSAHTDTAFALVALLHHADDPYTNGEVNLEELCLSERRAALRIIRVLA
jgi:hypothetical protein